MTWTEVPLFELDEPEHVPAHEDAERLSSTRRLTLRNKNLLAAGVHPATRLPVVETASCSTCAHHVVHGHNSRRYHKCSLVPMSAGAGTDIRASWPACTKWELEHIDDEDLADSRPVVEVDVVGGVL